MDTLRKVFFTLLIFVLLSCNDTNTVEIRISSDESYSIPNKNILAKRSSNMNSNLDPYGPYILKWSIDEIKVEIPEFISNNRSYMSASFFKDGAKWHDYSDALYLKGQFSNGKYEFIPDLNLYKVYRNIEKYRWAYLKVEPSKYIELKWSSIDDYWVATCAKAYWKIPATCELAFTYGEHFIGGVDFEEKNLKLSENIKQFIREKLDSYLEKKAN